MKNIKEFMIKSLLIIITIIVMISQVGMVSVIADVKESTDTIQITSAKEQYEVNEKFDIEVKGTQDDLENFKLNYPKNFELLNEKNKNVNHTVYTFKALNDGIYKVDGNLNGKSIKGIAVKIKANEVVSNKTSTSEIVPAEKTDLDTAISSGNTKKSNLEYSIDLNAQKDVNFSSGENYLGFPYKVTVNSTANTATALTGVSLTFTLPSGYELSGDSGIVTGPNAIVKEYSINADGTIQIVLNEIKKTIAEFTIAIVPITSSKSKTNVHDRYDGEILHGSIIGSETLSGKIPQSEKNTTLHGSTDYAVNKTAATPPASNNRFVTYTFNVNRIGSEKEITLQNLQLEDNIPAGAVIRSSNNAGGKWTITGNENTGWKAIWDRDKRFYGAGASLSSQDGELPSLLVEYPKDDFPDDTTPPKNTVTLSAHDNNSDGAVIEGEPDEAQGPLLTSGEDDSGGLSKEILTNKWLSSSIYSNYEVNGSYIGMANSDKSFESMTLEDNMDRFDNDTFWSHFLISNMNIQVSDAVVKADTNLTVSYKTNKNGWKTAYSEKSKSVLRIGYHIKGSLNYAQVDKTDSQIDLEPNEILTGWKVSVNSPKNKVENVQAKVSVSGVSSLANIYDRTIEPKSLTIQNTANQIVTFKDGSKSEEKIDKATVPLMPNLNLNTTVSTPSALTVGKENEFTVYANNITLDEDVEGVIMRVVLPAGVTLDTDKGVSAVNKQLEAPYDLDVPQPGKDIDISTEVLVENDEYKASRQVVVFRFKKPLVSLQTANSATDRNIANTGFKYNIPVNVSQVAYEAFIDNGRQAPVESWITSDSEKYKEYSVSAYGSRNHKDIHDFDKARDSIVWDDKFTQVIGDGNLVLAKSVEGKKNTGFSDQAIIENGEEATWKLSLSNTLSTKVDAPVIFDNISQLNGNANFVTTLTGPIMVSEGVTVEYSKDATTSKNGTWSTNWKGAKAFKITKTVLNIGGKIEAYIPVVSPGDTKTDDLTINRAEGEAALDGNTLPFTSNDAQIKIVVDTGSVILTKTDKKTADVLQGAVFVLQDMDGKVLQSGLKTDVFGELIVSDLTPGKYQLIETKAPTGYELDTTPIKFEIKKGQTEAVQVKMTNELSKGDVILTKTDDASGEQLQGAVFSLQDTEGKVLQSGLTTDVSGKLAVADLTPDKYQLVETKAPTGYELDATPIKFEIKKGQTEAVQVSMTNELTKGGFVLTKTADISGELLQGAVFTLQDTDGKVLQSGLTTDVSGKVSVSDLTPSKYQLVETKAPPGYELDKTPIKFEIKKGQTEAVQVSMTNELTKGGFVLTKTDDKTSDALQGAVFELQDTDGKVLQSGLITDASGKIAVSDLTPGNYQLVETKAPTGYELDSTPIKFEVKKGQTEAVQLAMTNELSKGGFVLTKTDNQSGEVLQGAVFELQDAEGKVIESGLTTDVSGKLAIDQLKPGNYQLVETKAPTGYELETTPIKFEVKKVKQKPCN